MVSDRALSVISVMLAVGVSVASVAVLISTVDAITSLSASAIKADVARAVCCATDSVSAEPITIAIVDSGSGVVGVLLDDAMEINIVVLSTGVVVVDSVAAAVVDSVATVVISGVVASVEATVWGGTEVVSVAGIVGVVLSELGAEDGLMVVASVGSRISTSIVSALGLVVVSSLVVAVDASVIAAVVVSASVGAAAVVVAGLSFEEFEGGNVGS